MGDKQVSVCPLYYMSARELRALREYRDQQLAMSFIHFYFSPAGALFLYVTKKDGSL